MKLAGLVVVLLGCGSGASGEGEVGSLPADLPDGGVGATHDAPSGTVQLSVTVSGPGRITSQPAGIDCGNGGTACSMDLAGDVTLATSSDSTVRWGGDCAGNGDCTVTAGASRSAKAETFAPLVRVFDGDDHGSDACHAIAAVPGGGFVITGEIQRLAAGRNAWTRRYDAAGTTMWTHELNTPSEGSDAGRGVVALADGSAIVAGSWYSGSNSRINHFVTRLRADGTVASSTQGELIGDDSYRSIAADPTGPLLVAGARDGQAWIRTLDGNGTAESWSILRAGTATNRAVLAANGDVLAVGGDDASAWAVRYHAGTETMTLRYGTGSGDTANDVAAFSGGFAVAGSSGGAGWLRVYDDAGNLGWELAPTAGRTWNAVAARSDGSIAVAGSQGTDLVVRSYAPGGALRWERTQQGAASSVAIDDAGNVLACGTRTANGNQDALAVQYFQ
jgi:hypothetical protein